MRKILIIAAVAAVFSGLAVIDTLGAKAGGATSIDARFGGGAAGAVTTIVEKLSDVTIIISVVITEPKATLNSAKHRSY
jgi:hypothetical protein